MNKKIISLAVSAIFSSSILISGVIPDNNRITAAEAAESATVANPVIWSDVPD